MSSIANPVSSTTGSGTPSSAATSPTDPLASESTFLTLLVSQLQNQDPLDPVDSNQFVSQLTEYSQLEQLIGIHSDTTSLSAAATAAATPPTSSTTPAASAVPAAAPEARPADPLGAISPNTVVPNSLNTGVIN
jgi:flagellar basal-body rod modification protein FlgD